MDMYLQFGYGMITIADELLKKWGSGGVILSPRDLDAPQLEKVAKSAQKLSADVLLDPQCYLHAADHERLTSHNYWQAFGANKTTNLIETKNIDCLKALKYLNETLQCRKVILPGIYAERIDDLWWAFHEEQLDGASSIGFSSSDLVPTLALSSSVVENESFVDEISERVRNWPCDRIYLVMETTSSYLSNSPLWLAGALQLTAGIKLSGKKILAGYCNHQMLPLGCSGVDAIASGTWLNVRAFQPEKFMVPQDDEISRRAKWYYCPQTLSEYKMPALDVAHKMGVLELMAPIPDTGYASPLFTGIQPSLVNWPERSAFFHYLSTLQKQCQSASSTSYDGAISHHHKMIESARRISSVLRKNTVRGSDRDFFDLFDVADSALALLDKSYGARLRRMRPQSSD